MASKLSKLKKGQQFKFKGKKKVYSYNGKVRMYSSYGDYKGWGYSYSDIEDISDYKEVFKDKDVIITFEY